MRELKPPPESCESSLHRLVQHRMQAPFNHARQPINLVTWEAEIRPRWRCTQPNTARSRENHGLPRLPGLRRRRRYGHVARGPGLLHLRHGRRGGGILPAAPGVDDHDDDLQFGGDGAGAGARVAPGPRGRAPRRRRVDRVRERGRAAAPALPRLLPPRGGAHADAEPRGVGAAAARAAAARHGPLREPARRVVVRAAVRARRRALPPLRPPRRLRRDVDEPALRRRSGRAAPSASTRSSGGPTSAASSSSSSSRAATPARPWAARSS